MIDALRKRGEAIAGARQRQKLQAVAEKLRAMFGAGAVQVEETRVFVSGRGLVRRWLLEPGLRFLGDSK